MRVRLLGPIDVVVAGAPREVPGLRRQVLLAALALRRGAVVDRDQLIGLVWPKDAPRTAANTLQSNVSYLRELAQDREVIQFRAPGYVLTAEGEETDVESAQRLIDQAAGSGDAADRTRKLRAALELWRGEVLGGVTGLPWLEEEANRLEHLRMRATHSLVGSRLELGEHRELLPELEQLVRDHPFDEQLHAHLMLALYRADRQVDALAAYQRLRGSLNDELGIDPSPALRALETAVLRQDPQLHPRPAVEVVPIPAASTSHHAHRPPTQLPASTAAFTGRQAELGLLDKLLAAKDQGAVTIATVAGAAGVGKTALAVRWAHSVRDQFPDGQLFVDLRGYATGPSVRPIDALAGFLAALGVPAEEAPVRVDQSAALYRTLMTGRRMLVVLDNAGSAEQVRPLLPGEPDCLVLVTSRERLASLVARQGAQPIRLDALHPDEAYELLAHFLGSDRLRAEHESTMELVRICVFLPLALRIAAATLAWQPTLPITAFVAQLRHDTLRTLSIEDDPEVGITAAFDASYRFLPEPARRLFRLLSLAPGAEITAPVAAALSDVDIVAATALLDRLGRAHLLDQPAPGRYAWHDLLRAYAGQRCLDEDPPATRDAAGQRLYDWYLSTVDDAADLLYPHMLRLPRAPARVAGSGPGQFADHAAALRWLDDERRNLVAAVRACLDANRELRAAGYLIADAMRGYFHLRRFASDWLVVAEAALSAAEVAGDIRALAAARHSLGTAYRCLGDLAGAREHYSEGLRHCRDGAWPEAEATALANLGIVDQGRGRLADAVESLTQALAIDRRTGRRAGVANNLSNLASVYADQGRLDEAATHFAEALELNRESGSRHGQALALTGLGRAYQESGRPGDAVAVLAEAMRHCTEVGDRDGEATVHLGLAAVQRDLGHTTKAVEHARAALAMARDGGDPRTEAGALTILADCEVTTDAGRREAAGHYARAYDLAWQATIPRTQIEALIGLADCDLRGGDVTGAARRARSALHRARWSGYRRLEVSAGALLASALDCAPSQS
jgi:DNA-binding SARP family transcriptional activator/tetratricopeptide (TPR) repeat protein